MDNKKRAVLIARYEISYKICIYFIAALIYTYFAGFSMQDDGLRNIAFAYHQNIMHSWGYIYPHSLFFLHYDPWHVWDSILAFYLKFFPYNKVHMAINFTALFSLMILLELLFRKFSKINFHTLSVFFILMIASMGCGRYINVRPDLLSGLFLMLALLLDKRLIFLFILTILYSSSYYLFFLYTGSVGLVYMILKNYRALILLFIGSLIGLFIHVLYGGMDFLKTVSHLLHDQALRDGLMVGEGQPLFSFIHIFNYYVLVGLCLTVTFTLAYKFYRYFKQQPIALLLLIMSPLWLAQIRYFEILQPLFFLYLLLESKKIIDYMLSRRVKYFIYRLAHIFKSLKFNKLFIVPTLLYTIAILGYSMSTHNHIKTLQNKIFYKDEIFNDKIILFNTLSSDIYYASYLNPTIRFVPSCSIGWFRGSKKMKKIYVQMMKPRGITPKELKALLTYVHASYFFQVLNNDKQMLSFKKLDKLGIKPIMIIDDKILFKNINLKGKS